MTLELIVLARLIPAWLIGNADNSQVIMVQKQKKKNRMEQETLVIISIL